MPSRRDFIKNTCATVVAGSLILPNILKAEKINTLGIQLWTVKDQMAIDAKKTLEKLANIGYKEIETFGGDYFKMGPKELRKVVEGLGMKLKSGHVALAKQKATDPTPEGIEKSVDDASEAGLKYIIMPWLESGCRDTVDNCKRTAEYFNQYGELCKKSGIKFGYHNHDFEFAPVGDSTAEDIFLQNTDPSLVGFELDLFWVVYAGKDPNDYIKKYPGRFPLWHVKDMDKQEKKSTEVGTGRIDFPKIFQNAKLAGLDTPIIEQEDFNRPSLESAKICFENAKKMKF